MLHLIQREQLVAEIALQPRQFDPLRSVRVQRRLIPWALEPVGRPVEPRPLEAGEEREGRETLRAAVERRLRQEGARTPRQLRERACALLRDRLVALRWEPAGDAGRLTARYAEAGRTLELLIDLPAPAPLVLSTLGESFSQAVEARILEALPLFAADAKDPRRLSQVEISGALLNAVSKLYCVPRRYGYRGEGLVEALSLQVGCALRRTADSWELQDIVRRVQDRLEVSGEDELFEDLAFRVLVECLGAYRGPMQKGAFRAYFESSLGLAVMYSRADRYKVLPTRTQWSFLIEILRGWIEVGPMRGWRRSWSRLDAMEVAARDALIEGARSAFTDAWRAVAPPEREELPSGETLREALARAADTGAAAEVIGQLLLRARLDHEGDPRTAPRWRPHLDQPECDALIREGARRGLSAYMIKTLFRSESAWRAAKKRGLNSVNIGPSLLACYREAVAPMSEEVFIARALHDLSWDQLAQRLPRLGGSAWLEYAHAPDPFHPDDEAPLRFDEILWGAVRESAPTLRLLVQPLVEAEATALPALLLAALKRDAQSDLERACRWDPRPALKKHKKEPRGVLTEEERRWLDAEVARPLAYREMARSERLRLARVFLRRRRLGGLVFVDEEER